MFFPELRKTCQKILLQDNSGWLLLEENLTRRNVSVWNGFFVQCLQSSTVYDCPILAILPYKNYYLQSNQTPHERGLRKEGRVFYKENLL